MAFRYPAGTIAYMSTIFRKTAKGVSEIETREHRLPPRVRNALILVDGKRDLASLKVLMPQEVDESLQTLLERAFIEVAGESVVASTLRAMPIAGARTMARSVADAQAAVSPAAPTSGPSFATRQRTAVRELHDAVGPIGEALAIRMERARDAAELLPLVRSAVQLIDNARGRSSAAAYAARHGS
jgi:hypothetical protein